jgi:hypothetical protein
MAFNLCTIKELRAIIDGLDEDTPVMLAYPSHLSIDGVVVSPLTNYAADVDYLPMGAFRGEVMVGEHNDPRVIKALLLYPATFVPD